MRITLDEVEVGWVACTGEQAGEVPPHRLYAALAEEAMLTAVQTLLSPGDRATVLRMQVEPPADLGTTGPLSAVASAVRLGARATTATVVLSTAGTVLGRGGVVCLVRTADGQPLGPRLRAL